MDIKNSYVGADTVFAMSRTLAVATAAAHHASWAHAAADGAAITPPRKRRAAAATAPSVDRGSI